MFLVGDAPPHADRTAETMKAVENLRQQGVRVFPVGASGVDKVAEMILRTASVLTLGEYLFLTDHSGVGNPHAKPDVPSYNVERLDRLMIRMIASELAGKRLVPEEIIAVERGECTWEQLHTFERRLPRHTMPQPQTQHQPIHHLTPPVIIVQPIPQNSASNTFDLVCNSVVTWVRGHLGSVLIAMITCVLAFDGLRRRRHSHAAAITRERKAPASGVCSNVISKRGRERPRYVVTGHLRLHHCPAQ